MFDLETWGTVPGCAIRSIGAVIFDTKQLGRQFYLNIDDQSCLGAGLIKDPATVAWWGKQSRQSQEALLVDPLPLITVMEVFCEWVKEEEPKYVWCHGACFDEPIWRYAANKLSHHVPWKYNVRCTRTLYDARDFDPKSVKRTGVYHNALDDAVHQATCVQAAWHHAPEK